MGVPYKILGLTFLTYAQMAFSGDDGLSISVPPPIKAAFENRKDRRDMADDLRSLGDSELTILYRDLVREDMTGLLPEYTKALEEESLGRPSIATGLLESILKKSQRASDFFDHSVVHRIALKMKNSSQEYRDTVGHFFITRTEALMDLDPSIDQIERLNVHAYSEDFPVKVLGTTLRRTKGTAPVLETIDALFNTDSSFIEGLHRSVCSYWKALASFYGGCDSPLRREMNRLNASGYLTSMGVRRLARDAHYDQNRIRLLNRGARKMYWGGYQMSPSGESFNDAVHRDIQGGGRRALPPALEQLIDDSKVTSALQENLSDRQIGRLNRYLEGQNHNSSIENRGPCSQNLAEILP